MVEPTRTTQSSQSSKIILWFWKPRSNPFDSKEKVEWKRYSDLENEHIEEAFQRKDKEVELNDYIISFEHNTQFRKNNRSEQRPLKRAVVDVHHFVREERFSYPERANTSFVPNSGGMSPFIEQWRQTNSELIYTSNFPAIAEFAAQGKTFFLCFFVILQLAFCFCRHLERRATSEQRV